MIEQKISGYIKCHSCSAVMEFKESRASLVTALLAAWLNHVHDSTEPDDPMPTVEAS